MVPGVFFMVFHGHRSVCLGSKLVFKVPGWFLWFQVGFYDLSWFQVDFSWLEVGFHGYRSEIMAFHGSRWGFHG